MARVAATQNRGCANPAAKLKSSFTRSRLAIACATNCRGSVSNENHRLGPLPFAIGGLSFIPVVGVMFGAVAVVWGLLTRQAGGRRLAQIGAAGAVFAAMTSAGAYYVGFVRRGGVYDRLRVAVAQGQLNALVVEIEQYKARTGSYPASLCDLHTVVPGDLRVSTGDPTDLKPRKLGRRFSYERVGTHHYDLRSAGFDGQLFTGDDVVPEVDPASTARLGLLLRPPAQGLGATAPHP